MKCSLILIKCIALLIFYSYCEQNENQLQMLPLVLSNNLSLYSIAQLTKLSNRPNKNHANGSVNVFVWDFCCCFYFISVHCSVFIGTLSCLAVSMYLFFVCAVIEKQQMFQFNISLNASVCKWLLLLLPPLLLLLTELTVSRWWIDLSKVYQLVLLLSHDARELKQNRVQPTLWLTLWLNWMWRTVITNVTIISTKCPNDIIFLI